MKQKLTLKYKHEKIVNKYIKQFELYTQMELDYWIGDRIGEVAQFGDYFFNFSEIKYLVDNNIEADYIIDWQNFVVEFEKCFINFESYCKLRNNFESQMPYIGGLDDFEKKLLYMRIKSDNND